MCLAAANRIISRTNAQNIWRTEQGLPRVRLTGKRLQKILYLCQLFWYTDHPESELITENFQAWPNGPVIPQIYNYFSVYQDGDMRPLRSMDISPLSLEESELINKVVDSTINIPTESMIDYTHAPFGPWDLVYNHGEGAYGTIPKASIRKYISEETNQEALIRLIRNGHRYACN